MYLLPLNRFPDGTASSLSRIFYMSSPATSISHGGSSGIKPDEIYTFSLTGFIESPPSWAFLEHLKMEVNHLNYLFFWSLWLSKSLTLSLRLSSAPYIVNLIQLLVTVTLLY